MLSSRSSFNGTPLRSIFTRTSSGPSHSPARQQISSTSLIVSELVTVQLVFHPGTEYLANAKLIDPPPSVDKTDIEDLVALYTMSGVA
jgi:hypothetical protein